MELKDEKTLAAILEEINRSLDVVIKGQAEIRNEITQKNTIIMQRINKLQEYNEIDDMRNKILNEHLDKVASMILEIEGRLY